MATSEQVIKSRNRNPNARREYLDYQKSWRESKKGSRYMNEYMKNKVKTDKKYKRMYLEAKIRYLHKTKGWYNYLFN